MIFLTTTFVGLTLLKHVETNDLSLKLLFLTTCYMYEYSTYVIGFPRKSMYLLH